MFPFHLWLLITHLVSSDYPCGIFWLPMWYIVNTHLVSSDYPMWYLQMKTVWRPFWSYIVKYRHIWICLATKIAVWRPAMIFLCHLISGKVNATRCVYLAILEYMTHKYVKSVLIKTDESSCETAMKDRNMAFGAEFYRAYKVSSENSIWGSWHRSYGYNEQWNNCVC